MNQQNCPLEGEIPDSMKSKNRIKTKGCKIAEKKWPTRRWIKSTFQKKKKGEKIQKFQLLTQKREKEKTQVSITNPVIIWLYIGDCMRTQVGTKWFQVGFHNI